MNSAAEVRASEREKSSVFLLQKKEKSIVCISGMSFLLYLSAALLTGCTGKSSVDGPPKVVQAFAGGDVVLPCSVIIPPSEDFPTVEWSKEGLKPNVVFLYRKGCETYEMKNPAFHYRTSFITKELKDGNISLRISKVRLSDAGRYQCMRLWKNAPRDITAVELVVVAVSEPKLSVVSVESGVTLQCEVDCSLPEPEMEFLDDRGNSIPADDPKRNQDTSGCFSVTRRVTLQDATNRVTCRVHQPEINQTRVAKILLPADHMRSVITRIAIGEGVVLLIAACGGVFYFLWKKCGKSAGKRPVTRQSSDQSTMSGTNENQPFLQSVRVDGAVKVADNTIEEVTEQADPKSRLLEKHETDHQPQRDLKSQSNHVVFYQVRPVFVSSPPSDHSHHTSNLRDDNNPKPTASSATLPQNQDPKPGILGPNSDPAPKHLIHRTRRIKSSPALLNLELSSSSSSDSTSKKKPRSSSRSMNESGARPAPKFPKLQRRHSSVLSSSDKSFPLLTDVDEESDS